MWPASASSERLPLSQPPTASRPMKPSVNISARLSCARAQLSLALMLTLGFMGLEAVGGWLSGSLSLLADAGHMLGDSGALVLALIAQRVAERPRTELRTYGLKRAEVLAAF